LQTEEQKRELDEILKEMNYEENLITNEVVMDRAKEMLVLLNIYDTRIDPIKIES
jgi:hypothetical protein